MCRQNKPQTIMKEMFAISHFNFIPQFQKFDLPHLIMYYISKNWTAEVYQKMIQTCKYFFAVHRIIVLEGLDHMESKKSIMRKKKQLQIENCVIDLTSTKLWITGELFIAYDCKHLSFLVPFIYRWDIYDLYMFEQILSIKKFSKISRKVQTLDLYGEQLYTSDDYFATLSDILALTPDVETVIIN